MHFSLRSQTLMTLQTQIKTYKSFRKHVHSLILQQPYMVLINYQSLPSNSILGFCDFLVEPTGCIFPRFWAAEKSITGGGAEEEIGLGEITLVTEPSGAYFLGLPLFFLTVVVPSTPAATAVDGVKPTCGGVTITGGSGSDPLNWLGFSVVLGATW